MAAEQEERLDVLTAAGEKTGASKPRHDRTNPTSSPLRSEVHRDGDYHRAVHVWIYSESTGELLLQRRADCKDSWPGQWDISSAGHISAGDSSLSSAQRELHEELGIKLPPDAFELLFVFLQECVINNGTYTNNEYNDVYLVTTVAPIPLEAFTLQESEVSAVRYMHLHEYKSCLAKECGEYVPYDVNGTYGQLFSIIEERYKDNIESCSLTLQKQINRYAPIHLEPELTSLSKGDREALGYILKASIVLDDVFHEQVWNSNRALRDWLKTHANSSSFDKLKWLYFSINKSPWSCLDENKAFLSTADSAVKLLTDATRLVSGWKGIEYRAAFPLDKPPGANFYPPDMDKMEFELWKNGLPEKEQKDATGFFTVIKRSDALLPSTLEQLDGSNQTKTSDDLFVVPYSKEYKSSLEKAAEFLHKASECSDTPSLKNLLRTKGNAFLSNDYYESDIAWMDLDSNLDITIGPYETYEDGLFSYKATFEAFVGIRDDIATSQVKLFGDQLQDLEKNLPLENIYKSDNVSAAPIRVINLLYNSGDVKGPQTIAFNLPNDERILNERGTSMVMLKNISEAKFKNILKPIANACIREEQKDYVDFEPYYTHIVCHECCHGIGPHSITLPSGKRSTVRRELQEFYSAVEEAKADIVGLWALNFLIKKGLLSKSLSESIKGQALQFNWLYDKGAFVLHSDGKFSVDFTKSHVQLKVEEAVESLSREILTIQAKGDKHAAKSLLQSRASLTQPLRVALDKIEHMQVPVDIAPIFGAANKLLANDQ
uniref:Nudix hydrolase domain-containing protein n=1 Tax=Leersia perrieri TaxID=77586 RepID=A0A0D9VM28_9ORYZ